MAPRIGPEQAPKENAEIEPNIKVAKYPWFLSNEGVLTNLNSLISKSVVTPITKNNKPTVWKITFPQLLKRKNKKWAPIPMGIETNKTPQEKNKVFNTSFSLDLKVKAK